MLFRCEVLEAHAEKLEEDKKLVDELLARGLANIGVAKKEHDILETFYIPNMRFQEIDEYKEIVLDRIMKYAKEIGK